MHLDTEQHYASIGAQSRHMLHRELCPLTIMYSVIVKERVLLFDTFMKLQGEWTGSGEK